MLFFIFFLICFSASVIGAICGIGGGILIKPLLDSFHIMDIGTISFLSGCTVLSMTTYSVVKSRKTGQSNLDLKISFPLSIGAALGGILGKWLFSFLSALSTNTERIGAIQAVCLFFVTLGSFLYTLCKSKITTLQVSNPVICITIGSALGIMSSFLGIGGGPINLVVLFFFFSMSTKVAAENSLYTIFFSQLTSLIFSVLSEIVPPGNRAGNILHSISKGIPEFSIFLLIVMVSGGITGGICGRWLNKKISEQTVNKLFLCLMLVILGINIYNIYSFTH